MTSTIKSASRRMTAFLAAILVVLGITTQTLVAKPVQAAFHQAYIQTTVDTSNWEILAGAVDVTSGFLLGSSPQEAQRMKNLLDSLAACETPAAAVGHIGTVTPAGTSSINKNLILTFPGEIEYTTIIRHSSTDEDLARATLVRNSLIYDLNSAFKFVYGYNYQPSGSNAEDQLKTYLSDIKNFLGQVNGGSGSCNGYTFSACSKNDISRYPDSVTNYTDYVKITNTSTGESQVFQYRMLKGYVDGGGRTNVADTLGLRKGSSGSDVAFIHWGHLTAEAFVNYNSEENLTITADNVYNSTPTAFEKAVSGFFVMLANGISSVLGLWSFDELIFNAGVRGTSAYVGGIFPTTWQSLIWTFFFIFEIAAIVILLYAIIFNVGRRAMATMNPIVRANAIDQIQYLFLVALALGLLPIVLQLLINLNMNLTGIFTDALGDKTAVDRFKNIAASSGSLMSALTSIVYLGAVIYFNVFYGIRSLMVAFLIITGPIFIAMMGISESKRRLTIAWAKEMAANIFIQPLQAMMLAFILMVPSTTRNIDSLVMAYAMIPLTNVLRGLFFGDSGGLVHQMAERGKQAGMKTLKTGAKVAGAGTIGAFTGGAAAFNAIRGKNSESSESGKDEQKGKTEESSTNGEAPANRTSTTNPSANQGKDTDLNTNAPAATGKAAEGVDAGAPTDSTDTGNQIRQSMANGATAGQSSPDVAASTTGDTSSDGKRKAHFSASGLATATSAMAMGAIGGGVGGVTRRVFGVNGGGAIATQLSKKLANGANSRFYPAGAKPTQSQENPMRQTSEQVDNPEFSKQVNPEPTMPNANSVTPKYSDVISDKGNVFENGFAERSGDQYRIDRDDMGDAGIRRTRPMDENQTMVSFDMDKLGAGDSARATAMLDMWNNCNEQERAILQEAGITDVKPRSKMVNGEEKITGMDMTVNSAAFAENFGTAFDKNGMTVTASPGAAPQMVPDVAGYVSQVKNSANNGSDTTIAQSAVSQVAQNMGITQSFSGGETVPAAGVDSGTQSAAIPEMVNFTASSQEALTNFMNEVPQLKQTNASITPVSNNGTVQYQMSVPKEQYDELLATQEMPSSQVCTNIMSARSGASAPVSTPTVQQSVSTNPEPVPQQEAPIQQVNNPIQEMQPVVSAIPQQTVIQQSGAPQQDLPVIIETPVPTKPIDISDKQDISQQPTVKEPRDKVSVKKTQHEEFRDDPPQKNNGGRSRKQEKQGGQFRH